MNIWPQLTGGETIDLLGQLRGGLDEGRRGRLVEKFDLDTTKKGRAYSKGNRQKVALVAAFASDVELLVLDEPTAGLDPLMEEVFRGLVAEERARGRTVLLSSHILSEVEALCDRVSIIRAGRTVETGSLAELRHLTRTYVDATLTGPVPDLGGLPLEDLDIEGARVRCLVPAAELGRLLELLARAGIESLVSQPPTLEQLFLRHYDPPSPDGAPALGLDAEGAAR